MEKKILGKKMKNKWRRDHRARKRRGKGKSTTLII